MSGGVDKLILLINKIEKAFLNLAREEGLARQGYKNVLDLRQTRYKLPVILYCEGRYNDIHKVELVGVARLGLRRTQGILGTILGDLSASRIYRIDLCTDIPGIGVWDLAGMASTSRTQNFKIYNNRGGTSFYLQNSAHKTILIYDKLKQLALKKDPLVKSFRPGENLTRVEIQFSGPAVPFRKLRHLDRYADIDLLDNLEFRTLKSVTKSAKPLHRLASVGIQALIGRVGLHATKKQFSSSEWAYVGRLFLQETGNSEEVLDVRGRLKHSIENWLNDRIQYPRLPNHPPEEGE